jgi:hypothetical protein
MPNRSIYPKPYIQEKTRGYGKCFDVECAKSGYEKVYLGRHDTREQAIAAYERYLATGEKPAKRTKRYKKPDERTARIHERKLISEEMRYDVRGKRAGENGKRIETFIGTFGNKAEAEAWKDRFIATGETSARTPREKPPRVRVCKKKRPLKVGHIPIIIAPNRNLRDHEIAALEQQRAIREKHGERAQREGESRTEWMNRIFGNRFAA